MNREKLYFGIGLVIGIVVAVLFLQVFAPRYSTVNLHGEIVKQDRWSGKSWRFVDNEWKLITETKLDWETIDKALRKALGIENTGVNKEDAFKRLKDKYPILRDCTDEELEDRIRRVYSREVLTTLYLTNFMKLEDQRTKKAGGGQPPSP